MTVTPFPGADTTPAPVFDIEVILAGIDTMAVQRPVAAQIVSVANSDDTDAKALARILSSDIALARNLNLSTVAEGVETAAQAEELARLGANFLQGFMLAKPMTGGHIAAWYAARGETSR